MSGFQTKGRDDLQKMMRDDKLNILFDINEPKCDEKFANPLYSFRAAIRLIQL